MTATSNRDRFPLAAALVDQFRAVFGPDVRVTYAENAHGESVGTQLSGWVPWKLWEGMQAAPRAEWGKRRK